MKRITAFITALAVMLCTATYCVFGELELPVESEKTTIQWDGKTSFASDTVYEISSVLKIARSRVLPKSSSLIVKSGGSLTVYGDGKLFISGKIFVEEGATLRSESFIRFSSGSTAVIDGLLSVREQGQLVVNSTMSLKNNGAIYNYGDISTGKSSSVELDGKIYNKSGAEITLKGGFTVSGTLSSYANVTAEDSAKLTVSGKMQIKNDTELNLNGGKHQLIITDSGKVSGKGIINRSSLYAIKSSGKLTVKLNKPETKIVDGVTYIGGILVVNKKIALPSYYGDGVDDEAYSAFLKMKADAEAAGFNMKLISSFRSYETQKQVYSNWCAIDGEEKASMYSAKAGHSEHQTGLAFDVTSLNSDYGKTAEGKWLAANCHEYGFIIRYPKNKTEITGYDYEPWHVRYIGKKLASAVKDSGLCLEEFLGII